MTKPLHETTKQYITEIRAAIKEFGEYNYIDKSPREVMDINIKRFALLPEADQLRVAKELMRTKNGDILAECIVNDLDNDGGVPDRHLDKLYEIVAPDNGCKPVAIKALNAASAVDQFKQLANQKATNFAKSMGLDDSQLHGTQTDMIHQMMGQFEAMARHAELIEKIRMQVMTFIMCLDKDKPRAVDVAIELSAFFAAEAQRLSK